MSSSTTTNKTIVILREQKDWQEWIEIIRSLARKAEIWELIDPNSLYPPLPLERPNKPTPASIKAGATSLVGFSPEEHGSYRLVMEDYRDELKVYTKRSEALADMCVKIQELVDRKHLTYTFDALGPYQMLTKLKARFAPTTYGREREILARWTELQKPRPHDLEMWLQEYETAYDDCVKYNVSADVLGEKGFHTFTQSIGLIDYDWARAKEIEVASTKSPDYNISSLIQSYRIFRENTAGLQKSRGSHDPFATFQEKQSDEKEKEKGRPCVCGAIHPWKECYYLVEKNRPAGWEPDDSIQEKIDEILAGIQTSYVTTLRRIIDEGQKPAFGKKKSRTKNRGRSKTPRPDTDDQGSPF